MNYSNYSFTLNLQIHQSQISIPVSLNDTARKLYITFIDGRKPYTIPDGCRAVFVGFKPGGTTLFNDCIIQENKTVIYEFTEQTANVEGIVNCEIRLYGEDGKQLTSSQFIMIVDENDTRDISLSENESTAIDSIIHAEIGRVEAEAKREAAEKSRKELAGFLATSGGVIVSDEEPKEGLANVWVDDSPEKEEIRLLDSTDIAQELSDDDEKIPCVALLKKSLDEIETGANGKDGLTPYIKDGNWWIGETDTGVKAEGKDGEKGDKGDKGDQGEQGIQGEKGDRGPQGPQGIQGPQGEQGIQGVQGIQGEQGEKGDKGDKGDAGADGKDGKDYVLTASDKNEIAELANSIPEYVKTEAEAVVDRVIAAQGNRTFTFAAITDLHYGSWGYYEGITDYPDGIKHACQALKYIDERLKLDAVAVLGDYTDGMAYDQYDTAVYDFKGVNAVLDKLRFSPNLRLVGNHDFHVKHSPLTYRYITAYSDDVEWGSCLGGYFYKDFTAQKIRVICLNTSEINHTSVSPTAEQYQWFINSLDLSAKENASDWHILILSHIPLDFWAENSAYKFTYILNAYIKGNTWDDGVITCDFTNGKNTATIIGNIHGHIHNLKVDKLYHAGSSTEQINVWRMATPNACFGKENKYDGYQEDTAYLKTANSASDTAFCVYCIDLDTYTIKAICYGAGYDRELNYDSGIIGKSYSIANNLTNVTNSNTTKSIAENGSYSATLTATEGEITSVTITMGGVDITSTAYANGNINISKVTGNITITAIAEVEEPEEPDEPIQIINQIPISTDIDGNIYNGKGYKENTRWSGSSNADSGYDGVDVTGYIPITYGDTIRLENIALTAGTPKNEVWYFEVKGTSYFHRVVGEFLNEELDENGNLIGFTAEVTGFMRVVASNIDDTSIITKNQPID